MTNPASWAQENARRAADQARQDALRAQENARRALEQHQRALKARQAAKPSGANATGGLRDPMEISNRMLSWLRGFGGRKQP